MIVRRTSGRTVELTTAYVGANAKPCRGKKVRHSTAAKQAENDRYGVKRLARLINCNMNKGDLLVTATYDQAGRARIEGWAKKNREEGESWEDALLRAAEREGQLYMCRIRRAMKEKGMEFRFILCTSDMDGETGEWVYPHHHVLLKRDAFELAAKKWPGGVDFQELRDQADYTQIAVYLCMQVRRRPDAKKWTCSRNLKRPVISTKWAGPIGELKPDTGSVVVERSAYKPGTPQYLRFVKKQKGAMQDEKPDERVRTSVERRKEKEKP